MELTDQHGFLEELLQGAGRDPWGNDQLYPSMWDFDPFEPEQTLPAANPSRLSFSTLAEAIFDSPFGEQTSCQLFDAFSLPEINVSLFPAQEDQICHSLSKAKNEELRLAGDYSFEGVNEDNCGTEEEIVENNDNNSISVQVFHVGSRGAKIKSKSKKIDGQPSKNLMAERRRRKRLNDRLSMLRSIVPKISKMDRTSILGDTIDYMKELLERIRELQEQQNERSGSNQANPTPRLEDHVRPNDTQVRNSPKFHVEMTNSDTRIDICCATRPGLLLSTVNTLEELGLEIQQCVISCFSDFSMQASCSEIGEQKTIMMNAEDIKQALFANAGYGGRCL